MVEERSETLLLIARESVIGLVQSLSCIEEISLPFLKNLKE